MSDTPTPRTEAETIDGKGCPREDRPYVEANFARQLERELAATRQIISDSIKALGTGSFALPEASLDFMKGIPEEIGLLIRRLNHELAAANAALADEKLHASLNAQSSDNWRAAEAESQREIARLTEEVENADSRVEVITAETQAEIRTFKADIAARTQTEAGLREQVRVLKLAAYHSKLAFDTMSTELSSPRINLVLGHMAKDSVSKALALVSADMEEAARKAGAK